MSDLTLNILMGHLVGDYVLQNNYLAQNKTKSSWVCTLHCLLYSLSMQFFCYENIPDGLDVCFFGLVFSTHWIIDRYSLADYYLKFINGRSIFEFYYSKYENSNLHILNGSFTSLVYAVTDNTFHLLFVYLFFKLTT